MSKNLRNAALKLKERGIESKRLDWSSVMYTYIRFNKFISPMGNISPLLFKGFRFQVYLVEGRAMLGARLDHNSTVKSQEEVIRASWKCI